MSKIFNLSYHKEEFNIIHHEPINMPVIETAHKHDFFMLLLISKGAGTHTIDFQPFPVKDRGIFFLAPGQAHQWNMPPDTSGWQITFNNKFLPTDGRRWPFFSPAAAPFLQLEEGQYVQLLRELESLQDEQSAAIVQHRLQIVLLLLQRWYSVAYPDEQAAAQNHIINRFLPLLEQHYAEQSNVGFYALKLHVNASYLSRVCSAFSGKTAGDYIRERILLEAKRMLTLTDKDVKGIAYSLGFKDTSYFSRFFKKYTNLTPVEFREQ